MIRLRYLAAVVVGLEVGLAAGWLSAPGDHAYEGAPTRTSKSRVADASSPALPPHPDKNGQRQRAQPRALPDIQQLRAQVTQCLYQLSPWRQAQCLRSLLRREIPATPWSGGLSGPQSPLRLIGQATVDG